MKKALCVVEIERIVLTGFDMKPGRAARLRVLVERELERLLQEGRVQEGGTSREVPHLHGPPMHVSEPQNDTHMAGALATSIAATLKRGRGA
jgi:hypothetical protein